MTHWKLTLSYDGTGYHGWQVQPVRPTIQGTLGAALHFITGERILPQGSGRTDAGVHALAQVATFSATVPIPAENLLRALNRALPPGIRVLAAESVPESFHARHSAVRKSYEYRIFCRELSQAGESAPICSPFLARYVWDCRWPLALEPMQQAAALLRGTHDFSSFAASDPDQTERESGSGGPNPVKTLFHSECVRENGLLVYRVTGSGFLHHMVRNIVGTLAEIGRGALTPADMPRILAARDRSAAGPTAPPQGLFLVSVEYEAEAGREVHP
jgi:tRNA pseudouridine38-40 synthase